MPEVRGEHAMKEYHMWIATIAEPEHGLDGDPQAVRLTAEEALADAESARQEMYAMDLADPPDAPDSDPATTSAWRPGRHTYRPSRLTIAGEGLTAEEAVDILDHATGEHYDLDELFGVESWRTRRERRYDAGHAQREAERAAADAARAVEDAARAAARAERHAAQKAQRDEWARERDASSLFRDTVHGCPTLPATLGGCCARLMMVPATERGRFVALLEQVVATIEGAPSRRPEGLLKLLDALPKGSLLRADYEPAAAAAK
jgi:hypothetical protein